jgi:hypothetical protein
VVVNSTQAKPTSSLENKKTKNRHRKQKLEEAVASQKRTEIEIKKVFIYTSSEIKLEEHQIL